jgi:hypothetical protein
MCSPRDAALIIGRAQTAGEGRLIQNTHTRDFLLRGNGGGHPFGAKFAARLANNRPSAPQTKAAHYHGDDHIRPAGAGAEYTQGGEHHGKIAERVIAGAVGLSNAGGCVDFCGASCRATC